MPDLVVHFKREPYDVFIGRPSKWSNPYRVGRDGTRQQVIERYRTYLYESGLIADIGELRGKTLGCWCKPKACHGDVLAELANDDLTTG